MAEKQYTFTDDELYEQLKYLAFCIHFEFEDKIKSCSTHKDYVEFLRDSKRHLGDCTKKACPCERCALWQIEIMAENMLDNLKNEKVGHCGRNCLSGCKGIKTK